MRRLILLSLLASSSLLGVASAAEARLAFRHADGSPIRSHGKPRVWCGPWEAGVTRPSLHVGLSNGRRNWNLRAVRRDVTVGRHLRFPNDFVFNRPNGAQLFVADGAIEASTAEEESSGSMVFSRLGCRQGDAVEFTIHAVLGSELFDGEPVRVSVTFRGRVSA